MAVCVLIWLGFGSLAYLFQTDNFSMAYVVEHSNRTLPAFFKFAAIWAGQHGSLLFWSFLLSIYIFSVLFTYRGKHPELMPYVGVVQGVGILLGAHWAYAVLGWGGYWMWDPVENASLMPWLTGTAFLHSVMMQEKRGMMRVWNVWLVFTTFLLTIFGTFLTRSGVVNSVHAFAQSRIGPWFLGFIGLVLLVCCVSFWRNRDYLRSDNTLDSLVSRESSFLFNNLILLVACVAVISVTVFPVLSEWVRGTKISVGVPFFNLINLPIELFLLFLTGVGPLLAWRKTSLASLRKNFGGPLLMGLVAGVRSEEHTSELQSRVDLVCRLLLEKKKQKEKPCRHTNR